MLLFDGKRNMLASIEKYFQNFNNYNYIKFSRYFISVIIKTTVKRFRIK